jgi:hypothetical protein
MRKFALVFVVVLLASAMPGIASTTDTIGNCAASNSFSSGIIIAQKVVASASETLTSIGVNFAADANSGNVVVGIYADTGGTAPTGAALAYGTGSYTGASGWVDVTSLSAYPSIVASTSYWLASNPSTAKLICWEQPGATGKYYIYGYDGTLPTWSTSGDTAYVVNMRMTYGAVQAPVYLNGLANVTYGAATTASCTSTNPCSLFRNETNITASENATATVVGVGGWLYKANETAGNSTTAWLIVSPADSSVQLTLNGSAADRNYTQYEVARFVATLNSTGAVTLNSSYGVFANGSGASPLTYDLNLSVAGDDVPVEASFAGNSTLNPSSALLHFNVTAAGAPPTTTTLPANVTVPTNVSATYCLDSSTLRVQFVQSENGTTLVRVENVYCQYGCDSVLSMCEPAPIIVIGIFAAIFIVAIVIGRRYGKI